MATISKRGGRWRAQVRRTGLKPLSATFESKARAQAWATQQEAAILAGRRGEYPKKSFADALDKFELEECPKRKGIRWEKIRIGALRRSTLAHKPVNAITEADIANWRNERLKTVIGAEKRPIKGATVRRELGLLNTIFDHAKREWKWCATNPTLEVTKPPPSKSRKRGVKQTEIDDLIAALGTTDGGIETALAFQLGIETAMRRGELWSLDKWQVDLESQVAHLDKTKNGDARDVPLSRRAVAIFKELAERNPKESGFFSIGKDTATALITDCTRAAGIHNLTFHDTRSEGITRLSKRLDILELAKAVGHRDLKSLMHYYAEPASATARKLD